MNKFFPLYWNKQHLGPRLTETVRQRNGNDDADDDDDDDDGGGGTYGEQCHRHHHCHPALTDNTRSIYSDARVEQFRT